MGVFIISAKNGQIARTFLLGTSSQEEYLQFFSDNCVNRASNEPLVRGIEKLALAAEYFRGMVQHVEHRVLAMWSFGDRIACEIETTYTQKDGQVFCLTCLDIFTINAGKISSLQILADLAPVCKPKDCQQTTPH